MGPRGARRIGALGALIGCAAVALAAAASHALKARLSEDDLRRVWIAAGVALAHAPLLVAIGLSRATSRLLVAASASIALGTLVFCGSLLAHALLGFSSALAPLGGVLLMAGWLVAGIALLRGAD